MTLICMLIALIIERLAVRSQPWQWLSYVRPYLRLSQRGVLATLQPACLRRIFMVVIAGIAGHSGAGVG